MQRTITVKGVGTASAKPDMIELSISLSATDKDYSQSAALASEQIDALGVAVEAVGFSRDELKTVDFNIDTEYNSFHDNNGDYHRVLVGYRCSHRLKLAFDFDTSRLSELISEISSCSATPEINVAFTVKEPSAISDELLKSAAENAAAKAAVLCRAAGATLGQLVSIDYSWSNVNFYSDLRCSVDECCAPISARSFTADFQPDDIRVSDSATFVWELA